MLACWGVNGASMFTELVFKDFRGFKELNLSRLGRINLVVGRNDSGKTSLLEGIALAIRPRGLISSLPTLLRPQAGGDITERYFRWLLRGESKVSFASIHSIWSGSERETRIYQRPKEQSQFAIQPNFEQFWGSGTL